LAALGIAHIIPIRSQIYRNRKLSHILKIFIFVFFFFFFFFFFGFFGFFVFFLFFFFFFELFIVSLNKYYYSLIFPPKERTPHT
jgi:hypothetical protein